jgi:hypothetical protein
VGQVTIYLDEDSERRLKSAAAAAGIPVSRWVAALIQQKTATQWPDSVRRLAGDWKDFPDVEVLRETTSKDVTRESF